MSRQLSRTRRAPASVVLFEPLEERRLLSGFSISFGSSFNAPSPPTQGLSISFGSGGSFSGQSQFASSGVPRALVGRAILFSQAPDAVQVGLNDLAAADSLPAPTDDQLVFLDNHGGVESFTLSIRDDGVFARLSVDQNGNPISEAEKTTTDWLTFSTDNPTAAAEALAIADALHLRTPSDDSTVFVRTQDGASTFTVGLRSSRRYSRTTFITVDEAGNPVGDNVRLPFSVLPSVIQDGLIANVPAGFTLDPTSTRTVFVDRFDGVQTYSMDFRTSRHHFTTVAVDIDGNLIDLPSRDSTTFDLVPAAAQAELQFLAGENGVVGTISDAQRVTVFNQVNGVSVYQVSVRTDSGRRITFSVDQDGNPTVPSRDDFYWFFQY